MPSYSDIFALVGAYARTYSQIEQLTTMDVSASTAGVTLRSIDNLAARFAELLNDSPAERDVLGVLDTLRATSASLRGAWPALRQHLDDTLASVIALDLGTSGDAQSVLAELGRQMEADSQSIGENTVGAGTPTPAASNIGNGVLLATIERATASGSSVESQLVRSQTIAFTCIEDSLLDGVEATRESWSAIGSAGLSASLPTVPVTAGLVEDEINHVLNGAFSAWASGDPQGFTLAGGALASEETTDVLFGASALRISGSGNFSLVQPLGPRPGNPAAGALCAVAVWVKVTSISIGDITIRLRVGNTPHAQEIVLDSSTPTGDWRHEYVLAALPADAYSQGLQVELVADGSFVGNLVIDGLSVAPLQYIGDGVSAAILPGSVPFVRAPQADRFTLATSSDEAGAFAVFLRDALGVELPASSSPTISDSLAI